MVIAIKKRMMREMMGHRARVQRRANEISNEIMKVLMEYIDEDGYGAVSPSLTMTILIGSEYGRYMAVVLLVVEHLAVVIRARLRRNDARCFNDIEDDDAGPGKNGIVQQPVSDGT